MVAAGTAALIDVPLIGAADDVAVASTAIGTATASAIARLRTWIFMEAPVRVNDD
jgi:hypothetical protein